MLKAQKVLFSHHLSIQSEKNIGPHYSGLGNFSLINNKLRVLNPKLNIEYAARIVKCHVL